LCAVFPPKWCNFLKVDVKNGLLLIAGILQKKSLTITLTIKAASIDERALTPGLTATWWP